MAAASGPRIVEDGLVFAYDMGSEQSWKGAPATNQLSGSASLASGSFAFSGASADSSNKFYSTNASAVTHYFLQNSSVTTGLNYTMTFEVKAAEFSFVQIFPSTGFSTGTWCDFDLNTGTFQISGGTTGSFASMQELGNGWWRCCYRQQCNATTGSGRFAVAIGNALGMSRSAAIAVPVGEGLWLKNVMFAQTDQVAVPWDEGTRSNTEAILDWKGGHTITPTSMTYNSDNTFSWDGSVRQSLSSTSADFTIGTSDFAMEAWYKPPTTASTYPHIMVLGSQATGMCLKTWRDGAGNDNKIYLFGGGGTYNSDSVVTDWYVTKGAYNHIAVSRIGGTMYCYLNGELKGSYSNPYNVTSTNFTIGDGVSVSEFTPKNIDKVALYSRGLTAQEIQQNFSALRGRFGI